MGRPARKSRLVMEFDLRMIDGAWVMMFFLLWLRGGSPGRPASVGHAGRLEPVNGLTEPDRRT